MTNEQIESVVDLLKSIANSLGYLAVYFAEARDMGISVKVELDAVSNGYKYDFTTLVDSVESIADALKD